MQSKGAGHHGSREASASWAPHGQQQALPGCMTAVIALSFLDLCRLQ